MNEQERAENLAIAIKRFRMLSEANFKGFDLDEELQIRLLVAILLKD